MDSDRRPFYRFHRLGEAATYPIARRAGHLAALLLLAGDYPAAASRLASRPARRPLEHVQLPFLGSRIRGETLGMLWTTCQVCARRKAAPGLMIHSDRDSQYASGEYQQFLNTRGFVCSMSRKANCWGNAPAECFFHTLKTELIHQRRFETRDQAQQDIFEYVEAC